MYAYAAFDFFSFAHVHVVLYRRIGPFASRLFAAILSTWLIPAARVVKMLPFATKITMAFARRSDMIRFREKPSQLTKSSSTIGQWRFRSLPPRSMCWRLFSATCSMRFFDLAIEFGSFA